MKRGPKAQLPSEKMAKGTYQKCRDAGRVEVIEPLALPHQPDWLTAEAVEVWLDDIGRVKLATESDSTLFANYCTLQGGILKAVRANEMPPIGIWDELREDERGLHGSTRRCWTRCRAMTPSMRRWKSIAAIWIRIPCFRSRRPCRAFSAR